MRRITVALAALVVVLATGAPTTAAAPPWLKARYSAQWHACLKEKGCDPGRNIRRDGLRVLHKHHDGRRHWHVRRAVSDDYKLAVGRLQAARAPAPAAHAGGILAAIRACENGGRYDTHVNNGFYGAYQFTLSTWYANGGKTHPARASPAEQDRVAWTLYKRVGVHTSASWPNCP